MRSLMAGETPGRLLKRMPGNAAMVRASADLAAVNFENCRTEEDIGIEMYAGGLDA